MYTMVLADDEEIELKALGLLIQKEFRDIDVVATARNGTELVTQVQRHQPDMAIVDINMPGISGIDAIDLLRSRGVRTRFIINTAYDEFDYVQRALALKIDAYILKPEKRETTVATIQKLCAQIDETRANAQSQRQIRELFTRIQPVMESEIMYSIFIGEPALANFEAYCEMHAAQFTAGAVVALVPVTPSRDGLRGQDKQVLRAALDAAFGGSCTYLATVTETNLCLLLFVPAGQSGGGEAWLNDVVQVALTKLNRSLQLPLRAGVGGVFGQFRQMQESYSKACWRCCSTGRGLSPFTARHSRPKRAAPKRSCFGAWCKRAICSRSAPKWRVCNLFCRVTAPLPKSCLHRWRHSWPSKRAGPTVCTASWKTPRRSLPGRTPRPILRRYCAKSCTSLPGCWASRPSPVRASMYSRRCGILTSITPVTFRWIWWRNISASARFTSAGCFATNAAKILSSTSPRCA